MRHTWGRDGWGQTRGSRRRPFGGGERAPWRAHRSGAERGAAERAAAGGRLGERIEGALSVARRSGRPALAAITERVPPELDLSAAVLNARRPTDRFACLEQPDRDGFVLAGLGQAATLEARGPGRF